MIGYIAPGTQLKCVPKMCTTKTLFQQQYLNNVLLFLLQVCLSNLEYPPNEHFQVNSKKEIHCTQCGFMFLFLFIVMIMAFTLRKVSHKIMKRKVFHNIKIKLRLPQNTFCKFTKSLW